MSMIGQFRLASADELASLHADPDRVKEFLSADEGPLALSVDKEWHGLHFLLTGTGAEGRPPLNFIVAGGREIGDVDLGYGPARSYSPAELKTIAAAIEPLTEAVLRPRFDPEQMAEHEIYPNVWDPPVDEDETLGYLIDTWNELRTFIASGASKGLGLIVYLT